MTLRKFIAETKTFDKSEQLRMLLAKALRDGMLSDVELQMVNQLFDDSGISASDYLAIQHEEFRKVLKRYVLDRKITDREYASAYHIALQLNFTDEELVELVRFLDEFH